MNGSTIALALEAAIQAMAAAQRYAALARTAQAEGRELTTEELRQLRLDDDAARARQGEAILAAAERERQGQPAG